MKGERLSIRGHPNLVEPIWPDIRSRDPQRAGKPDARSFDWRWQLDEIFVKIRGKPHYLWRAVDHEGKVLEPYVTMRRDRKAALKFLRKSTKRYDQLQIIVTDKLRSYGAAMKVFGNDSRQKTGRWLNNRAENSYLPF